MTFYTIQYTVIKHGFIQESQEYNYQCKTNTQNKFNELANIKSYYFEFTEQNNIQQIIVYNGDMAYIVKMIEKQFED